MDIPTYPAHIKLKGGRGDGLEAEVLLTRTFLFIVADYYHRYDALVNTLWTDCVVFQFTSKKEYSELSQDERASVDG